VELNRGLPQPLGVFYPVRQSILVVSTRKRSLFAPGSRRILPS
jgi:hypothetical protein